MIVKCALVMAVGLLIVANVALLQLLVRMLMLL